MTTSIPEPALGGIPPPKVLGLGETGVPTMAHLPAPVASLPELFECRISWVDDAAIVEVSGEIDIATAPTLENAIASIQESATRVVVNLSQVSFLDSSALKVLTQSQIRLGERDALRVVLPANQTIRKIFETTRLIEPLGVVDSIDAALRNR